MFPRSSDQQEPSKPYSEEPHDTVQQVATEWNMDTVTIRKLFRDEPGVLRLQSAPGKRVMLRIPKSVKERVHQRLRKK
jgi:hypothetical protein